MENPRRKDGGSGDLLGGNPGPLNRNPRERKVLSLGDAVKRRWGRQLAAELAALENGPEPPRAA